MAYGWYHGTPATGAEAFYQLKELLKAQGSSVLMSGDGLALYSAVGDVITGPGAGANGMANTRAWFRVQLPNGKECGASASLRRRNQATIPAYWCRGHIPAMVDR